MDLLAEKWPPACVRMWGMLGWTGKEGDVQRFGRVSGCYLFLLDVLISLEHLCVLGVLIVGSIPE